MSPERTIPPTFTIGESASTEARVWVQNRLSSDEQIQTEIEKLKNRDEVMYKFLFNMGFLRNLIQFGEDKTTEQAYWSGAFYMLNAVDMQYASEKQIPPTPSQDQMKTHFFNLIDAENNHGAATHFAPHIFDPENEFFQTMSAFFDGYGEENFDVLAKLFAQSSQYRVNDLFYDNHDLRDNLTRTSLNRTHGPALGLVYGAFDVYELYRLTDESQRLEGVHQIEIR